MRLSTPATSPEYCGKQYSPDAVSTEMIVPLTDADPLQRSVVQLSNSPLVFPQNLVVPFAKVSDVQNRIDCVKRSVRESSPKQLITEAINYTN